MSVNIDGSAYLDVESLKNKANRIKNQLHKYEGRLIYSPTKKKLVEVSVILKECNNIIDKLTEGSRSKQSQSTTKNVTNFNDVSSTVDKAREAILEPISCNSVDDGSDINVDLSDVLPLSNKPDNRYIPKYIVGSYIAKLSLFSINNDFSTGFVEVDEFSNLLNNWFKIRYLHHAENFNYRAEYISNYIDLMILKAGHSLHLGAFNDFVSTVNQWLSDLSFNSSKYSVPVEVSSITKLANKGATLEAVLIEKLIKPYIYDDSFYPDKLNSIEDKYLESSSQLLNKDIITVNYLINLCPTVTLVSNSTDEKLNGVM